VCAYDTRQTVPFPSSENNKEPSLACAMPTGRPLFGFMRGSQASCRHRFRKQNCPCDGPWWPATATRETSRRDEGVDFSERPMVTVRIPSGLQMRSRRSTLSIEDKIPNHYFRCQLDRVLRRGVAFVDQAAVEGDSAIYSARRRKHRRRRDRRARPSPSPGGRDPHWRRQSECRTTAAP
jgi:hypothetical protein